MSSEVLARSHLTGFFFFPNLLQLQQQWALWMNVNAMFTWWSGSHRSPLSLCFVYLWFYSRLWWFFLGFILFHFCSIWSVPWLVPQCWAKRAGSSEFSLQQRGPYCVLYSVHRTTAASWCFTVQLDPLYSWYCAVMLSVVWTQRSLYHKWWSMENEPSVRKSVLLTFSGRTVLSSRCMYSRVLVPSTWNCSVFIHYGMWVVTWQAVVAISAPSMKSLSLA